MVILSHKMTSTGLDRYSNIVFLYFHMHHYCGYTAIPPAYDFTLWLTLKLWAVLAALPCLHSWDTRLLNCTWSRTAWCRAKRGAQPCVREHSIVQPNVHPWSTTKDRPGQEPERQWGTQRDNCRGQRWRTNPHPLLSSLTPNTVHLRACNSSQCGGGKLWKCCVLILFTHLLLKLQLSKSCLPTVLHPHIQAFFN